MALVKEWASNLDETHFRLLVPPELKVSGSSQQYIPFRDLDAIKHHLEGFEFKCVCIPMIISSVFISFVSYYGLPHSDNIWNLMSRDMACIPIPKPGQTLPFIDESCVADEIRIDTPLDLQKTPCPVTVETTEAWSTIERLKVASAYEVRNIRDFKEKVFILLSLFMLNTEGELQLLTFHAGGIKTSDSYLLIDSNICEGCAFLMSIMKDALHLYSNVLHIRGANNKFLVLLGTNLMDHLPHNNIFVTQLSSIMEGEIFEDFSKRPDFSYLAWHCSYYNRYAEQVSRLISAYACL